MDAGPPFERYPGPPPRRGDDALRVVSPVRDAVVWISIAGPLQVTTYLRRSVDGWREVLPRSGFSGVEERIWELAQRDPVEIMLRTIAGDPVTASVRVSHGRCELRIEPTVDEARMERLVVMPPGAVVTREGEATVIRIFAG